MNGGEAHADTAAATWGGIYTTSTGERVRVFSLAESLGGVESLVAHPATMTHASMDAAARATAGISDSLLRLSVGIESPRDLVADLERALDVAAELSAVRGELAVA